MNDHRGFTLAEMMIVLFILGLALAFVLPNVAMRNNLPAATRQLIGMIRGLSLAASTYKETHRLNLDIGQGTYWATVISRGGENAAVVDPAIRGLFRLPPDVVFRYVTVSNGASAASSRSFIDFYPIGNADRAVIHIGDGRERTALILDPITADVRMIQEGEPLPTLLSLPEHLQPLFVSRTASWRRQGRQQ